MKHSAFTKTTALVCILTAVISIFASCGQQQTPLKDFVWEENYSGISITEYKGTDKHIIVPEIINNKKVTSVGYTFNGNVVVESIVLPSGCPEAILGDCENLKKITFLSPDFSGTMSSFPQNIETVKIPNATEITLSASYKDSLLQSQKLKKLELSSATKLQAYTKDQKMITEKLSVTLSKDLRYYANIDDKMIVSSEQITKEYISKYLIPHGVEYTYDETSRRYIVNITKELTPEVAPEVYCTLFGRTKVAVNGTTYTVSE